MTDIEIDEEFELLREYLDIYIQLLPDCVQLGGNKIHKPQLPTFEYFKKTYHDRRYSLSIPHYKEAKKVYDGNKIGAVHTHGIGSMNGIGYRYYNIWMGCKYFTGGNINGDYTIETETVNQILKLI